jgi:hypothetical protein
VREAIVTLWSVAWLSVLISVLTLLATCRVTRLITEDTITKPARDWIHMKAQPRHARPPGRAGGRAARVQARLYGEDPNAPRPAPRAWRYLSKLVTCPWCSGFWVSAALTLAYYRCWLGVWPTASLATGFSYLVAVFAMSWVTAIAADWLDSPPPPKEQVHSGQVTVVNVTPPNA